jgi:hypothetical protein
VYKFDMWTVRDIGIFHLISFICLLQTQMHFSKDIRNIAT